MAFYLTVNTTYTFVQIGLFFNGKLIDLVSDENKRVSKYFICLLESLLSKNNITINQIDFFAASIGPAPFTTLRVSLASINGLAFALNKPVIEVNGLETFIKEYANTDYITVALMNAFSQDLYYAIAQPSSNTIITGCSNGEAIIKDLKIKYSEPIKFIGNGSVLYKDLIFELFGSRAILDENIIESASLETLGSCAYKLFKENKYYKKAIPLYLKEAA